MTTTREGLIPDNTLDGSWSTDHIEITIVRITTETMMISDRDEGGMNTTTDDTVVATIIGTSLRP